MAADIFGFRDTIHWYDENAEKYAANIENIPSIELVDRFANAVGKKGKVLDAGCAAGRDSRLLKDRNLTPVGIDLYKSIIEIARKKYPDIHFEHGNLLELPFENETFDGVWAHASLLHFETTEEVSKALQEFNRVLKQDGIIHVFVKQQPGEQKTEIVSDRLSGHDRFFQYFTKDEIQSLLEQAGFSVEEIQDEYKDPAGREEVKWVVSLARKQSPGMFAKG